MRSALSALVLVLCSLTVVHVQQRPDLSGTWVATTDAPQGVAAAPSAVFGPRFAIAQDATHVTLTRTSRDGALPVKLPLDGSELRWRVPARACEAGTERIEKIAVEGTGLAYTFAGMVPAGASVPRPSNIKYLIRAAGPDTIEVEGTMVQQGQSRQVATVYKRSAEPMPAPPAAIAMPKVTAAPATIAQAEWIGGTWIGTTANGSVEERWTPSASGAMFGIGRTLRGPSLASFEFLCIVEREGSLVYTAMPGARTPPTYFTLTSLTADSATFENPGHDYPKLIRYTRLPDGSLQTTISAGGDVRAQSVVLKKQ